jgi:hypothetical protein
VQELTSSTSESTLKSNVCKPTAATTASPCKRKRKRHHATEAEINQAIKSKGHVAANILSSIVRTEPRPRPSADKASAADAGAADTGVCPATLLLYVLPRRATPVVASAACAASASPLQSVGGGVAAAEAPEQSLRLVETDGQFEKLKFELQQVQGINEDDEFLRQVVIGTVDLIQRKNRNNFEGCLRSERPEHHHLHAIRGKRFKTLPTFLRYHRKLGFPEGAARTEMAVFDTTLNCAVLDLEALRRRGTRFVSQFVAGLNAVV